MLSHPQIRRSQIVFWREQSQSQSQSQAAWRERRGNSSPCGAARCCAVGKTSSRGSLRWSWTTGGYYACSSSWASSTSAPSTTATASGAPAPPSPCAHVSRSQTPACSLEGYPGKTDDKTLTLACGIMDTLYPDGHPAADSSAGRRVTLCGQRGVPRDASACSAAWCSNNNTKAGRSIHSTQ